MTDPKCAALQNAAPASIPLIVGVTGHRDLLDEDLPRIQELVREALQSMRKKYPETPLVVLSPLVDGADQLVAEIALEKDLQARLVAVLPWPEDMATERLARGGDQAKFQQLLTKADKIITVPLDKPARDLAVSNWTAFEQQQHELVGKYIARHSQLLIALWDGDERESSGTARVVSWQRNGAPAPFAAQLGELDVVEGAPIFHITVRRRSRAETFATPPLQTRWLFPASAAGGDEEVTHRTWSYIDRYNQDIGRRNWTSEQDVAASRSWVVPENVAARLPPPLRELLECYAAADAVALSFQRRVRRLVRALFLIGPLALICLEVYAHLWSHWPALAGYLLLLTFAYGMFSRARRFEWEGRYLDARALAEALRVQFFWRLAGLTDCAAEHYLRHLRGELGWIRQASRTCFLLTGNDHDSTEFSTDPIVPGSEESLHTVLQYWVHDQERFFRKRTPTNEHLELRCERIAKWSFRTAIAIAVIELIVHRQTDHSNHLLIVLTFFGLVAAALAEEIADHHTFGILARKYEWMKNLFASAAKNLEAIIAAGTPFRARALIHDLGLEALNENADWLVQRRRKPVVLPKG